MSLFDSHKQQNSGGINLYQDNSQHISYNTINVPTGNGKSTSDSDIIGLLIGLVVALLFVLLGIATYYQKSLLILKQYQPIIITGLIFLSVLSLIILYFRSKSTKGTLIQLLLYTLSIFTDHLALNKKIPSEVLNFFEQVINSQNKLVFVYDNLNNGSFWFASCHFLVLVSSILVFLFSCYRNIFKINITLGLYIFILILNFIFIFFGQYFLLIK